MNTPLPCSGLTLPWSQLRYQYPDKDVSVVTKISLKSYQDLRYFLSVNLLQFRQILAQIWDHIEVITNDRPIASFKHMKHYAKDEKSQCKHPYRFLPSPSWIMVTNWDLGNEYPFRYREFAGSLGEIAFVIGLAHWGRYKMAAIFWTPFSNAFSWMKMLEFRLRNHWNLFLRFELTIFLHCFR